MVLVKAANGRNKNKCIKTNSYLQLSSMRHTFLVGSFISSEIWYLEAFGVRLSVLILFVGR